MLNFKDLGVCDVEPGSDRKSEEGREDGRIDGLLGCFKAQTRAGG